MPEVKIANKFVFLDFYAAALCNLRFKRCGSYMEQVWPPLQLSVDLGCRFNNYSSINHFHMNVALSLEAKLLASAAVITCS